MRFLGGIGNAIGRATGLVAAQTPAVNNTTAPPPDPSNVIPSKIIAIGDKLIFNHM